MTPATPALPRTRRAYDHCLRDKEFVEHYMTERFHQGIGGQLIRNINPTNDNGADGKVACRPSTTSTYRLKLALFPVGRVGWCTL